MSETQRLVGYCLPFNAIAVADGAREFVEPFALDAFLARRPKVYLNIGGHDAPPITTDVELFKDSYGLSFRTRLTPQQWLAISTRLLTDHHYCSVFFDHLVIARGTHKGRPINQIVEASIAHVTLCGSSAVYGDATGVWPIGDYQLPDRLVLLRERFRAAECGRLRAQRRERERWFVGRQEPPLLRRP